MQRGVPAHNACEVRVHDSAIRLGRIWPDRGGLACTPTHTSRSATLATLCRTPSRVNPSACSIDPEPTATFSFAPRRQTNCRCQRQRDVLVPNASRLRRRAGSGLPENSFERRVGVSPTRRFDLCGSAPIRRQRGRRWDCVSAPPKPLRVRGGLGVDGLQSALRELSDAL